METMDLMVKGIPVAIMNMFRGFCTLEGKSDSQGIIDVMIDFIDKQTGGSNPKFKELVAEYKKSKKK